MACNTKTTATATAATTALGDFKNPYDPTADAVTTGAVYAAGGTPAVSATSGNTVVSQSTTEVSVSTCIADDGAATPVCELKTNTVSIE